MAFGSVSSLLLALHVFVFRCCLLFFTSGFEPVRFASCLFQACLFRFICLHPLGIHLPRLCRNRFQEKQHCSRTCYCSNFPIKHNSSGIMGFLALFEKTPRKATYPPSCVRIFPTFNSLPKNLLLR